MIPDDEDFNDDDFIHFMYNYHILIEKNPLQRFSQDSSNLNYFEYKLEVIFKSIFLVYILAMDVCQDNFKIGYTTNYSVSFVEYLVLSSRCFALIEDFAVLDFNPLFSNVYCGLYYCLRESANS